MKHQAFVLWAILLISAFLTYSLCNFTLVYLHFLKDDNWILKLILNLLGYSIVFVPGLFIYLYIKRTKYLDHSDSGYLNYIIKHCFGNSDVKVYSKLENNKSITRSTAKEVTLLFFCTFGLLISYVTWGIVQERIMTQKYVNSIGEIEMFKDSQFLVFVNRLSAFILSGICILIINQPRHTVPLYKYTYCSFSNIMSSWCQYEALKYISYPTQVLTKASKIIPVMLMGKLLFGKKYEFYEYITSVSICIGMALFVIGSDDVVVNEKASTTFSGLILITGYLVFDSFTSNWQSNLFKSYSVSSLQMMCGVNLFSCLFTIISLLQQNEITNSWLFAIKFPSFAYDCLILSICSATGQLFIFYTISVFGPVVFVIIMAVRQAMTVMISCVLFNHIISVLGHIGIFIVFTAIFLRAYCSHRLKKIRTNNTTVV